MDEAAEDVAPLNAGQRRLWVGLLAEIRRDLEESPFVGEGPQKVSARLRGLCGIRT